MRHKYPSGEIPQFQMDEFAKERKIYRFKQFLKNKLFKIIFRDAEFMRAHDKSKAEKEQFETERKQYLPSVHNNHGVIIKNPKSPKKGDDFEK